MPDPASLPVGSKGPVDHASSLARELWDRARDEISAGWDCPHDTETHASKVRSRYLELWDAR